MNEFAAVARLLDALRPWLDQVVFVGGWAHRLYRFHELAHTPTYSPLRTKDADVVLSTATPIEGDIASALRAAGFKEEFSGEHTPPVTHYHLGEDQGEFYAEFLVPLVGSDEKRGKPDVTVRKAGVIAQKLRYVDLLLEHPWAVRLDESVDVPVAPAAEVQLANPASFIAQKLLIHKYRSPAKQAQDALYIHDTLELFASELDGLRTLWIDGLKDTLPPKTVKSLERAIRESFGAVNDVIRSAARIPQDRSVRPARMQQVCAVGLEEIFLSQSKP